MESLFNLVVEFAPAIRLTFFVFLGLTAILYGLCAFATPFMVRLNSVPWAFHLRRNLDVTYQGVLYAAFHMGRWAQVTHWSLAWDVVLWFVLFWALGPVAVALALVALVIQAFLLGDRRVGVVLSGIWMGVAGGAWALGGAIGWDVMVPVSMVILMASGLLRFLGHVFEPLPPGMVDDTDRFIPLKDARPVLGLMVSPLIGIISEFAAGLPFRLFVVQGVWMADRLGMAKEEKGAWGRWRAEAEGLHQKGWLSSPVTAWMRSE